MGSAIGARLRDGGARVVAALDGRSERTRRLAAEAGVEDVGTLEALVHEADIVLSVVPPGSALEVAEAIAAAAGDARPLVADLNATSPTTVERIDAALAAHGLETVDGSISGRAAACPGHDADLPLGTRVPRRSRVFRCRGSSSSSSAPRSGSRPP